MCKVINFEQAKERLMARKYEEEQERLAYEEFKNQPGLFGMEEYMIEYAWNLKKKNK